MVKYPDTGGRQSTPRSGSGARTSPTELVVHSVTKFLNGHSDVVGGILVFRDTDLLARVRRVLHHLGGTMDPHQAWLVLQGLRTLALRVRQAQENAWAIVDFLVDHPAVAEVRYTGLPGTRSRS
jgi:cystathionine beta-lyase/cystathionine gamma-synthase